MLVPELAGGGGGGPSNSTASRAPIEAVPAPPDFDLNAFASQYTGNTLVKRLMFLGLHCPDLAARAYRMAMNELRTGCNTIFFHKLIEQAGPHLQVGSDDLAWAEQADRQWQHMHERLENDLAIHKTDLVKDNIRRFYLELGDLYSRRGDPVTALKNYASTRDYCSTVAQTAETCLQVVRASLESGNYIQANTYLQRALKLPVVTHADPLIGLKLNVAHGIVKLEQRDYKECARSFVGLESLGKGEAAALKELISAEDIARYGGLCAIATFGRDELRSRVIESPVFKEYLENSPVTEQLIMDFYHSRYGGVMDSLQKLRRHLLLDSRLSPHVPALYQSINDACVAQYLAPYLSVSLKTMADAFGWTVPEAQKAAVALIVSGRIGGRVDMEKGTLHARTAESRRDGYQKLKRTFERQQQDVKSLLLRMSCIEHDIMVKAPGGRGGGGGGGDRGPRDDMDMGGGRGNGNDDDGDYDDENDDTAPAIEEPEPPAPPQIGLLNPHLPSYMMGGGGSFI